jgi:hypothetical protein
MTNETQQHPDLTTVSQLPTVIFNQLETAIKTSKKLPSAYKEQCIQMCITVKDQFYRTQIEFTNEGERLISQALALPETDEKNRLILYDQWQKMVTYTTQECELIMEPVQKLVQYLLENERKLFLKCFTLGGVILLKDLAILLLITGLVIPHCVAGVVFTVPIWGWIVVGAGTLGLILITFFLVTKIVTFKQIRDSICDTLNTVKGWLNLHLPKLSRSCTQELSTEELSKELNQLLHYMRSDKEDWQSNIQLEYLHRRIKDKNIALKEDRDKFRRDNDL